MSRDILIRINAGLFIETCIIVILTVTFRCCRHADPVSSSMCNWLSASVTSPVYVSQHWSSKRCDSDNHHTGATPSEFWRWHFVFGSRGSSYYDVTVVGDHPRCTAAQASIAAMTLVVVVVFNLCVFFRSVNADRHASGVLRCDTAHLAHSIARTHARLPRRAGRFVLALHRVTSFVCIEPKPCCCCCCCCWCRYRRTSVHTNHQSIGHSTTTDPLLTTTDPRL